MLEKEELSHYDLRDYSEENRELEEKNFRECLEDPALETVFERHGWKQVKDFYKDIPTLLEGEEYFFLVKLDADKINDTAFANTLLGVVVMHNRENKMSLKCNVVYSDDGENHFWLRKTGK